GALELRWLDLAASKVLRTHVVKGGTGSGALSTSGKTLVSVGTYDGGFVVVDLARDRDVHIAERAPSILTSWALDDDVFIDDRSYGMHGDPKQAFDIVAIDAARVW